MLRHTLVSLLHGSRSLLLPIAIGLASFQPAAAVNVSLELDLLQPADPINVLTVTLAAGFPVGSDTEKSRLSGSVFADIELDLTTGLPVPTELTFLGGLVEATDVRFRLLFGSLSATTMNLGGTATTPLPPGTVTDGSFDASEHLFTLNQGTIEAAGETVDFAMDPVESAGIGFGSIELTPVGVPQNDLATFDVRVELPILIDETIPIDGVPIVGSIDLEVDASGVIVSQDRITVEIPRLLACDTNLDGDVDAADRTTQTANWTGALAPGLGDRLPSDGDCDLDLDVDAADVTMLVTEWTGAQMSIADARPTSAVSPSVSNVVPEPTSTISFMLGIVWMLTSLRRRSASRRSQPS